MPPWYPLVAAARFLGTDPWVLEKQPVHWMHRALAAAAAEAHAQDMQMKHAK